MLRISIEGGPDILGRPHGFEPLSHGLFVAQDGFDGWDDGGGEIRRESIDRPYQDGEFDLEVFQGSRVITIDGHAIARSEQELADLRRQITWIGAAGQRFKLTVEHQGEVLWAMVRRAMRPTFKDAGVRSGLLRARFMLQLVAADPRKYGETREFPGGVAAHHFGNQPARPRLLVGAGSGGYAVNSSNGGRVFVQSSAPSGAHVIDFVAGGLFLNGVRQVGVTTTWRPWTIPPGSPGVVATMQGSSRSLVQVVEDTFD